MLLARSVRRAFAAGAVWFALSSAVAPATGTMNITPTGGGANTYDDVEVKVLSGELFLTSRDGQGTIVVNQAACSYQAKIIVCYPSAAALVQNGTSQALTLKSGTIYLNYTNDPQPLSGSSSKLSARGILLAFTTRAGTSVTLRGRIDEVIRE